MDYCPSPSLLPHTGWGTQITAFGGCPHSPSSLHGLHVGEFSLSPQGLKAAFSHFPQLGMPFPGNLLAIPVLEFPFSFSWKGKNFHFPFLPRGSTRGWFNGIGLEGPKICLQELGKALAVMLSPFFLHQAGQLLPCSTSVTKHRCPSRCPCSAELWQ